MSIKFSNGDLMKNLMASNLIVLDHSSQKGLQNPNFITVALSVYNSELKFSRAAVK